MSQRESIINENIDIVCIAQILETATMEDSNYRRSRRDADIKNNYLDKYLILLAKRVFNKKIKCYNTKYEHKIVKNLTL